MYIYKDIAFRTIDKEDLKILRHLHNDQSTFLNLLDIDFIDENSQNSWWENLHKNKNDKRYVIVDAEKPKEILGRLRIQNINFLHNNCEIGMDILPKYRRQGFGSKCYEMLLEFLFLHYNMHMVYLKVADFNPNAKRLYEKVGFEATGYFKDFYYRHGRYWNYILMCLTKKQYFQILKNDKT